MTLPVSPLRPVVVPVLVVDPPAAPFLPAVPVTAPLLDVDPVVVPALPACPVIAPLDVDAPATLPAASDDAVAAGGWMSRDWVGDAVGAVLGPMKVVVRRLPPRLLEIGERGTVCPYPHSSTTIYPSTVKFADAPAIVTACNTTLDDTGTTSPVGHDHTIPAPIAFTDKRRNGDAAIVGATDQAVAAVDVPAGSPLSSANNVVGVVRVPIAVVRDKPTDMVGVVPVIAATVQPSSRILARSVAAVPRSTIAPVAVIDALVKAML